MECKIREDAPAAGASRHVYASGANERLVRDGGMSSTPGSSRRNRDSNGELNSDSEAGQEQVIRWELFLPRRFIRVLLVENDDSTRHIVAALLRKCNYLVAAVADGLKAWEVLKERNYNFDLVLTEVVMPSLSGIGLLSKIMSKEICKNIPVIMMSSNDSIGVVFKCMLKGAADFLVKPVRKNELRNLWQHVWRKYCSKCSKSEIESKSVQKQVEPLEIESRSLPEETDSKLEKHYSSMAKVVTSSIHENGKADEMSTGIEIKVTLSIQEAVSNENVQEGNGYYVRSLYREEDPASVKNKESVNIDPEILNQNDGTNLPSREIIESIQTATTEKCSHLVVADNDHGEDILFGLAKSTSERNNKCNSGSSPLWELSLRGTQLKDHNEEVFQEKHVLKHSDASAFSRYGTASSRPSCTRLSSSPILRIENNENGSTNCQICPSADNSRNIPFPLVERTASLHGSGAETLMNCHLSTASNKEAADPSSSVPSREFTCAGHSSVEQPTSTHPQLGIVPFSIPVGAIPFQSLCAGYGTVLHPVFYSDPSVPLLGSAEVQDCNHFHNVRNYPPHQLKQVMQESRSVVGPTYPRVLLHTPAEVNLSGNCSFGIGTASGSNGIYEDTRMAVNAGSALERENEYGFQNGNGKELDQDHSRREAALTKFRLKRKDRCFEKKVRYHNRKKLAEKRPRVKGQFVRQAVAESTTIATESDD